MDKIGINLGYFLVQLFNFGILYTVILAWVVKPVLGMLERRKETFRQGLEDARMASEARANAEHEADRIINWAQKKASEIMQERMTARRISNTNLRNRPVRNYKRAG